MSHADHAFGCACATHLPRPWNRPEHWTRAEVAYLETWFGRRSDAALARKLGRTVMGVRLKAKRLGLRKRDAGLTAREVARLFGVDPTTVGDRWIAHGVLRARRAWRQGPKDVWLVDEAEVERFIREHPEWVDVDKMSESTYRDLAARDPWIGLPEVHRRTGRDRHRVAELIHAGTIRGRKRGTHWYVPVADLPGIRHLSPDAIAESVFRVESRLAARRNRRKLGAAA